MKFIINVKEEVQMLNLAKGYKIYKPERLNEEYEVTDDVTLMANVGVEKIKEVFQHFIVMHGIHFLMKHQDRLKDVITKRNLCMIYQKN